MAHESLKKTKRNDQHTTNKRQFILFANHCGTMQWYLRTAPNYSSDNQSGMMRDRAKDGFPQPHGETMMKIHNKFNPGGIKATLKRWYEDPTKRDWWLVFDGVMVRAVERLDEAPANAGWRSICLIKEIGDYLEPESPYGINELLWHREVWPEREWPF